MLALASLALCPGLLSDKFGSNVSEAILGIVFLLLKGMISLAHLFHRVAGLLIADFIFCVANNVGLTKGTPT